MILYLKDPKNSNKKLFYLINTFSNIARYKINTQRSGSLPCTSNEQSEKEIMKTILFTISSKN
jgi:hypothetical protein